MKITKKFLGDRNACKEGVKWVENNNLIGLNHTDFIKKLIKADRLDWASWLITRIMNYRQFTKYAIYAAEQVIDIYEKKYPSDKRPRNAIEAAKKCLKYRSKKNKAAAAAYADAAYAAAAAYADAAYAAYAADAADAAYAAAYADAAYAAAAARKNMRLKILKYGLKKMRSTK